MTTAYDATTIYQTLEQDVLDDLLNDLNLHYARTVDPQGDLAHHRFVLTGLGSDDDLLRVLADFQDRFNPDNTRLDASTRGVFLAFDFNDDRIENAPPKSGRSYGTVTPYDARSRTVSDCAKCHSKCPDAYPELIIQHRPESPYATGDREEHDLCVHCSPGHYDDVVRNINAFGVHDGTVETLLVDVNVNEEDNYRTEWEQQWHDYEQGDNPYVDDVVKLIERDLL